MACKFICSTKVFMEIFTYNHKNGENITMELVLLSIMGDCVCKIVCQFVGMGSIYFWVCVFVGWWLLGLGLFLVVGC